MQILSYFSRPLHQPINLGNHEHRYKILKAKLNNYKTINLVNFIISLIDINVAKTL